MLIKLEEHFITYLILLLSLIFFTSSVSAKSGSTWYTKEMVMNARANVKKYSWARDIRDRAVRKAEPWIKLSDEELWSLVPPATLPRPSTVNWGGNCPACNGEMTRYNFRYLYDKTRFPWKVTCPSCFKVFPSNDFEAYYKSGIGEDGQFQRDLADSSLLYNKEHPDPEDPLHKKFVDDGRGWVDDKGVRYNFVGQYVWEVWSEIFDALEALGDAYIYTGDGIYAYKAAILLDRIADLYPEMDITETVTLGSANDGGSRRGKLFGRISETFNIRYFAKAYDIIYEAVKDDEDLYAFLRKKAEEFRLPTEKGNYQLFCSNVEERILREGAQAVIQENIRGNMGMHQYSMGVIAVVYDKEPWTSQWLEWIFRTDGGGIDEIIIGRVDRDGYGDESGIGYARGWLSDTMDLADLLNCYMPGSQYDLYTRYGSKFERWYHTGFDLLSGKQGGPGIGDSDKCGNPGGHVDITNMVKAFETFETPRFAQIIHWGTQKNLRDIHSDIFHPEPEAIRNEINKIVKEQGSYELGSVNLGGYGFIALREGDHYKTTLKSLWMYYGRNSTSHAHRDRLNLGLMAFNLDLMPELGYPERTGRWPKRLAWTSNTISHNTVVVDRLPQYKNWSGKLVYFIDTPGAQVMEIDGNGAYPIDTYIRTSSLIEISSKDFYVVDIFRARGGNEHLYSFHGAEGRVTTEGLDLVKEEKGTYFGEDVEFAADVYGDYSAQRPGQGFQYLHSVQRGNMKGDTFSVEYDIVDTWGANSPPRNVKLRLTGLGEYDHVDLALGDPPQLSKNPKHLQYVLVGNVRDPDKPSTLDEEGLLSTQFTMVIEAYEKRRVVKSIERLQPIKKSIQAQPVAIKVEVPGRVDYIISSLDPSIEVEFEGGIKFKGRYGVISMKGNKVTVAKLVSTSYLKLGNLEYKEDVAEYRGKVVDFDKGMPMESHIYVDTPLPTDGSLVGLHLVVMNDGLRDAGYRIEGVERVGDKTRISIGRYSLVRGYTDKNDPFRTLTYNIKEGDTFYIPLPKVIR